MTTASAPPPAARPLRRASKARRDWRGWAFVGPFMIVFLAVLVAPVIYALVLTLFRQQLVGGTALRRAGATTSQLFQDPKF